MKLRACAPTIESRAVQDGALPSSRASGARFGLDQPHSGRERAGPRACKKRGLFGFLFKSALGCTSFALGVLIVVVLLLPTMLSGLPRAGCSRSSATSSGRSPDSQPDLAWFGEQHVTSVVVRDPDKEEVARASVVMPSLWSLVRSGGERRARDHRRRRGPRPGRRGDHELGACARAAPSEAARDQAEVHESCGPLGHARQARAPRARSAGDVDAPDVVRRRDAAHGDPVRSSRPEGQRHREVGRADRRACRCEHRVEQPGKITLDAHVGGPIAPEKPCRSGKVEAHALVEEGFSTAMIDGVARMHGDLKEVLGNRFTLKVDATGSSADEGDVDFVLDGEKGRVALHGRLESGALRSRAQADSSPALLATIPPPRGFLQTYVTPSLPPGARPPYSMHRTLRGPCVRNRSRCRS